jgi:hypothetical protein
MDRDWEVVTQKGAKKRAEIYINMGNGELLNFRGQAVERANRFTAPEANRHLLRNEDGLAVMYEETICTLNKDLEKMKHIAQNYSITSASQEKLNLKSKIEHNLQNHSLTNQLSNTKMRSTTHQT